MTILFVFVNYSNPSQSRDRAKRQIISTHIGRFHRNRSGPSRQKEQQCKRNLTPGDNLESFPNVSLTWTRPLHASPHRGSAGRAARHSSSGWEQIPQPQKNLDTPASPIHDFASLVPILDYYLDQQRSQQSELGDDTPKQAFARPNWHPSPLTLVGQGRVDPFARFAVDEDYTHVHLGIDYAVQHFWPTIAPKRCSKSTYTAPKAFLTQMKSFPLLYYSYLLAIVTNYEWMTGPNPMSGYHEQLRLRNGMVLFRDVRREIEGLQGLPSDDLIGAVLVLGSNFPEMVSARKTGLTSRFRSPLADVQLLNQYGAFAFPATHWRAFVQLVKLCGGLSKIKSKDLAGDCQLGDLIESSRYSTTPDFEYCTIYSKDSDADRPEDGIAVPVESHQASYFANTALKIFESSGLQYTVRTVIEATIALETHIKDKASIEDAHNKLLGLRNRAQWHSLKMNREGSEAEADQALTVADEALLRVISLALLIYNNLVLFPLPPISGLDTRLATSMRHTIEGVQQQWPSSLAEHPKLFLWAMMLGGISDSQDLNRLWFLEQFRSLLGDELPGHKKWSQVEHSLLSCMWLGAVLNDEAINFWADSRP